MLTCAAVSRYLLAAAQKRGGVQGEVLAMALAQLHARGTVQADGTRAGHAMPPMVPVKPPVFWLALPGKKCFAHHKQHNMLSRSHV